MTASTPIVCRTDLLFPAGPQLDPAGLAPRLRQCMIRASEGVTGYRAHGFGRLEFDGQTLQVTITVDDTPVAAQSYYGAARPVASIRGAVQVLDRLNRHRTSITVTVSALPSASAAPTVEAAQTLCRAVTRTIAHATRATLIYWRDTGVLFTPAEFAEAGSQMAPAAHGALSAAATPDLDPAPAAAARAVPAKSRPMASLAQAANTYGLVVILAALSAPVAGAALLSSVVRGENPRFTAQLVSLSGLAVALDLAAYPARVLALF